MFEIPVGDLLASFSGDSKELEFRGDVLPGLYDDLEFSSPLDLKIKLVGLDDGVTVIIERLETEVIYDGITKHVLIEMIEREFKQKFDPLAPDDIKFINMSNVSIDLTPIIREEILIQCIE